MSVGSDSGVNRVRKKNPPLGSRPQTKSGHVQFWSNVVTSVYIAEYGERGEGNLQGALDLVYSLVRAIDHGGRFKLLVFFAKYYQMCGSCQGQRSGAPFRKMRNNQISKEQPIFFYFFFSSRPTSVRHGHHLFKECFRCFRSRETLPGKTEQSSGLFF